MKRDDVSADIRLYLRSANEGQHAHGLGRGIVDLCERVEASGSLNKAAAEMGMAYSKAWRIIKSTEEALGLELFVRQGARGSTLTDNARILVRLYRTLEKRLTNEANSLLDQAFSLFERNGMLEKELSGEIEKKATPDLIAQVRGIETDQWRADRQAKQF